MSTIDKTSTSKTASEKMVKVHITVLFAEAIASMKEKIEQISQVVALNVQTSVESTEIAHRVSEEVGRMDEIVSEFRI